MKPEWNIQADKNESLQLKYERMQKKISRIHVKIIKIYE